MISVVVQAGGESRRMGQDKALLPFLRETLLERVVKRVNHLGDELLVTTNHPERFPHLQVPLVPDELPGQGALGGLLTALVAAQFSTVIIVACDMPFVNSAILADASDQLLSRQADVVIPRTEIGYEPLHAVYRRETCLPAVQRALRAGEKRMISWFPSVKVIAVGMEDLSKHDPLGIAFWNLNTPGDLQQAEKLAKELG